MIAAMVALFSGCLLMWFYAIASLFAFKSSMIFLILAGSGTLCLGLGLALIPAYKKYYDFYNKKMGWEFPDKPKKEEKTTVDDGKKSFKDYFTLSNISLAIIALGAVFTIISAALGCINRDTWVDATSSFMKESGFYNQVEHRQMKDSVQAQNAGDKNISTINIDFKDKQAIIIYTSDSDKKGFIVYDYYVKYDDQISRARSKDGVITLYAARAEARRHDDKKDILLYVQRFRCRKTSADISARRRSQGVSQRDKNHRRKSHLRKADNLDRRATITRIYIPSIQKKHHAVLFSVIFHFNRLQKLQS